MIFNREKHFQSGQVFLFNFRKKRADFIKKIIIFIYEKNNSCKIIDLGCTEEFWNIIDTNFLYENNVKITLINLHPYEVKNKQIFKIHHMDFFSLNPKDFSNFDLSFSNSVIEHLENDENQRKFASLHKTIAKYYYCQTPNKHFPIEPHFIFPFFQYLPKQIQIILLVRFNIGNFDNIQNENEARRYLKEIQLLSKKDIMRLFSNNFLEEEKFFFLVKSYVCQNIINSNLVKENNKFRGSRITHI